MADTTNTPPYMSYGVFTKSIETLAGSVVPSGALDRRVLSGLSGNDYAALIPGLRYLGLVDDERKATALYRELIELWPDQTKFKSRLIKLLEEKYAPIIGDVNLKNGTGSQFEKAFRDAGVASGQMLTKSIRFFVKALTECGFPLSPYITARRPATKKNGTDKPKPNSKQQPPPSGDSPRGEEEIPNGFERMVLPTMPNSFIQYPTNLTELQCGILEGMVNVIRTAVAARSGGKDKKP